MVISPINSFHVGRFKDVLTSKGIPFSVLQNHAQAQSDIQAAQTGKLPNQDTGIYKSSGDHVYLEIPDESAPLIQDELEKMGLVYTDQSDIEKSLEESEYFCLSCDYSAGAPVQCPTHQTTLLEYSDWVHAKSLKDKGSGRVLLFIAATVAIAFFIYSRIKN